MDKPTLKHEAQWLCWNTKTEPTTNFLLRKDTASVTEVNKSSGAP